jgi:uncharacterized protein YutE (UPF0331/DUF86 family)
VIFLDKDRLFEKIDELENYLRELEEYLPEEEEEYLNSGLIKRACERAFQLAGENLLDICNLIISEKGFGIPSDSKDSIRKLAENGVIPGSLSTRLEELVGFRELKDFYEFIETIDKYIELETGKPHE